MSVLDASAVYEFLIEGEAADEVTEVLQAPGLPIPCAPSILVFELVSALRRAELGGGIDSERAAGAVSDLGDLPVELLPTLPLRERAWDLRRNFTAGDAMYAALAESLGEPLVTGDKRLARAVKRHLDIHTIVLDIS